MAAQHRTPDNTHYAFETPLKTHLKYGPRKLPSTRKFVKLEEPARNNDVRAVAARQLLGNGLPRKVVAFFTKDLQYPFDVSYLNASADLYTPPNGGVWIGAGFNATSRGGTIGFLLRACRVTNATNQAFRG